MAIEDKRKWDEKYAQKPKLLEERQGSRVLSDHLHLTPGKKAMELACGAGRNTLMMARHGFEVDALDIAAQALQTLQEYALKYEVADLIRTNVSDLDSFQAPEQAYDLIVMTNYLDRDLIERSKTGLKPGGLFLVETYMLHPENEKVHSKDDYMLKPGELKQLFSEGFETLYYGEFENEPFESYRMHKQAIVAKKG